MPVDVARLALPAARLVAAEAVGAAQPRLALAAAGDLAVAARRRRCTCPPPPCAAGSRRSCRTTRPTPVCVQSLSCAHLPTQVLPSVEQLVPPAHVVAAAAVHVAALAGVLGELIAAAHVDAARGRVRLGAAARAVARRRLALVARRRADSCAGRCSHRALHAGPRRRRAVHAAAALRRRLVAADVIGAEEAVAADAAVGRLALAARVRVARRALRLARLAVRRRVAVEVGLAVGVAGAGRRARARVRALIAVGARRRRQVAALAAWSQPRRVSMPPVQLEPQSAADAARRPAAPCPAASRPSPCRSARACRRARRRTRCAGPEPSTANSGSRVPDSCTVHAPSPAECRMSAVVTDGVDVAAGRWPTRRRDRTAAATTASPARRRCRDARRMPPRPTK